MRAGTNAGRTARGGMYYQYFGLTEAPFSIAVNPRYLFMSARHRDALAHLLYGGGAGGGVATGLGDANSGSGSGAGSGVVSASSVGSGS